MIVIDEIKSAQHGWAEGVLALGRLKDNPGECRRAAEEFLVKFYSFDTGQVLFKPTKASQQPFRFTQKAALSYFIGGDPDFSEDSGFALRPWISVQFNNAGIQVYSDTAIAMGHYTFLSEDGLDLLVEYTFGYIKEDNSRLRIKLHHSSLPFCDT